MVHPAELDAPALLADCDMRRQRRSGPGGQHRNKVETAVVLVHRPSGVRAEATERRSQYANRVVATKRLRINLALEVRTPRCREHGPSPQWQARCQGGRFRVNRDHDEFPAMLAEALDVIAACHYALPDAAAWLTTTSSQLVRLLRVEPRALERVNQQRVAINLRPLK